MTLPIASQEYLSKEVICQGERDQAPFARTQSPAAGPLERFTNLLQCMCQLADRKDYGAGKAIEWQFGN